MFGRLLGFLLGVAMFLFAYLALAFFWVLRLFSPVVGWVMSLREEEKD